MDGKMEIAMLFSFIKEWKPINDKDSVHMAQKNQVTQKSPKSHPTLKFGSKDPEIRGTVLPSHLCVIKYLRTLVFLEIHS